MLYFMLVNFWSPAGQENLVSVSEVGTCNQMCDCVKQMPTFVIYSTNQVGAKNSAGHPGTSVSFVMHH
jgi:hypothetical protein